MPPTAVQSVYDFDWSKMYRNMRGRQFLARALAVARSALILTFHGDARDSLERAKTGTVPIWIWLAWLFMTNAGGGRLTTITMMIIVLSSVGTWRLLYRTSVAIVPVAIAVTAIASRPNVATITVASLLILAVVLRVAYNRFSWISAVAAAIDDSLDIRTAYASLAAKILNLQRENNHRIVIVAHSLGGYITYSALLRLRNNENYEPRRLRVLAVGSGLSAIRWFAVARVSRLVKLYETASILGILTATLGMGVFVFFSTLLTTDVGADAQKRAEKQDWQQLVERFAATATEVDVDRQSGLETFLTSIWTAQQRSLIAIALIGFVLVLLGAFISRRGYTRATEVVENVTRLDTVRCEAWVDCCSVHDTVGRASVHTNRSSLLVPLPGYGIPLLDHPSRVYLSNASVQKILRSLLHDPLAKIKSRIRDERNDVIYRLDLAARVRDCSALVLLCGIIEVTDAFDGITTRDDVSALHILSLLASVVVISGVIHYGVWRLLELRAPSRPLGGKGSGLEEDRKGESDVSAIYTISLIVFTQMVWMIPPVVYLMGRDIYWLYKPTAPFYEQLEIGMLALDSVDWLASITALILSFSIVLRARPLRTVLRLALLVNLFIGATGLIALSTAGASTGRYTVLWIFVIILMISYCAMTVTGGDRYYQRGWSDYTFSTLPPRIKFGRFAR